MTADTQKQTEMYAESSDVCSSFARHPENRKVAVFVVLEKLRVVDSTDSELAFDGRNQRGALEESTSQGLESTGEGRRVLEFVVESQDSNIFLSSTLLRLDQPRRTIYTDNETASYFGVKCSAVTSLIDA